MGLSLKVPLVRITLQSHCGLGSMASTPNKPSRYSHPKYLVPSGTTIGAIVRNQDEVLIAHDHIVIQHEDHVILFLTDKRRIPEVERLFSVAATFL